MKQIYDLFISYTEADHAWVEGYLLPELGLPDERIITRKKFRPGVPIVEGFVKAVERSRYTVLVLSPAYLDDESAVFGEQLASWRNQLIPLIWQPCDLPLQIDFRVSLDCSGSDQTKWKHEMERLREWLDKPPPALEKIPCPYPGMRPFSEEESERFYGREGKIQSILEKLRLHPLVAVIGPSGSGKSSLISAGLVPALRYSQLFGPGDWLVDTLRPGEKPMTTLSERLPGNPPCSEQAVNERLARHSGAQRLLLVVDQFEELFTLAQEKEEKEEKAAFQEALVRLAQVPGCFVVLSLRADFYSELMGTPIWQSIEAHREEVLPFGADGLRQAIVRPAEKLGVSIDPVLVERLINESAGQPGILPFLQETLVLLWEKLERRYLPTSAYEALTLSVRNQEVPESMRPTGLQVAMEHRADAAWNDLTAEQQPIARRIFLRLVQFGEGRADTRRQQPAAALRASNDPSGLFEQTLSHLVASRLLTVSGKKGESSKRIDLAHEALIAGWSMLKGWLAERREAEQTRRLLESKAVEWERLRDKGNGGLLDEVELLEAERWLARPDVTELGFSNELVALVEVSRTAQEEEAARQRRIRRLGLGAVVAIVGLIIVALVINTVRQSQLTEQEREAGATAVVLAENERTARATAEASAQELSAQLTVAESQRLAFAAQSQVEEAPETALLLAYEALSGHQNPVSEETMRDLLDQITWQPTLLSGHEGRIWDLAFSPDGKRILTVSDDKTVRLWDDEGKLLTIISDFYLGPFEGVGFSPDSKRFLTASNGTQLWDADGTLLATLKGSPIGSGTSISVLADSQVFNILSAFGGDKSQFFGPDGERILTASGEELHVWNISGELLATFSGHTDIITSGMFSPDQTRLLTACKDGTVRLWDTTTGELLTLNGHTDKVNSALFSPNGTRILTASDDKTVRLWDVEGTLLDTLNVDTYGVNSAVFSPDGTRILTASRDRVVWLWEGGTRMTALRGHTGGVESAVFNLDGTRILTTSSDQTARLWNIEGDLLATFAHSVDGQLGGVIGALFSSDGRRIVTGSSDGTVKLWDSEGKALATLGNNSSLGGAARGKSSSVLSATFSPDGNRILIGHGDGTVRLWDRVSPPLPTLNHDDYVYHAVFDADANRILTASRDGTAKLWDSEGNLLATLIGHTGNLNEVTSALFSPDGNTILTTSLDKTARLWDTTGKTLTIFRHDYWVKSAVFSPDGTRILTASYSGTARLWDTEGKLLTSLKGHLDEIWRAVFSPDGKRILTASSDKTARLWDTEGEPLAALIIHENDVMSAEFSPDGRYIVTGSTDGAARLWDAEGNLLSTLSDHTGVWRALFNSDSTRILTVDVIGVTRLWNVTGELLITFSGHKSAVMSGSFSPDEKLILTSSMDGTTRLWNIEQEKLVTTLGGHTAGVFSAVFSPDGTRILTASLDGTAKLYFVNREDLLAVAACRVGRGLTENEMTRFDIKTASFVFEERQCPPVFSWQR